MPRNFTKQNDTLLCKMVQRESHSLIVGQTVGLVITTSDGSHHNYCMTFGTIALLIYFTAIGLVFYYMIRKDFFDHD